MTKVEELRERVLGNYPKIATNEKGLPRIIDIIETVDALISVARSEGKAEGHHDGFHEGYRDGVLAGEEQERERIRKYCETHPFMRPQDVITASALDSTKEKP